MTTPTLAASTLRGTKKLICAVKTDTIGADGLGTCVCGQKGIEPARKSSGGMYDFDTVTPAHMCRGAKPDFLARRRALERQREKEERRIERAKEAAYRKYAESIGTTADNLSPDQMEKALELAKNLDDGAPF